MNDMDEIRAMRRAAEIQRQIQAQIARQQAELAEQRRQAEAAKKRAEEAARAAWEAEEQARRAKSAQDKARTQTELEMKNAELDSAAADWQHKEKQVKLTEAELADAKERQKDPTSTKTRPTQAAVTQAEGELKDAGEVKDLLDSRVTAMKKEAQATKAEADAVPDNWQGPVAPGQKAPMVQGREKAVRLRAEANDAWGDFNKKLVAWDVKQKKTAVDTAEAKLPSLRKQYHNIPQDDLESAAGLPQARADYTDALARQKVVNASADATHKQVLALQADDKVTAARAGLMKEQKELGMCVADSPATRELTKATDEAKQAHAAADTALASAAKSLQDYELASKKQDLDAAKADLQAITGGQYGPYVPGTAAGDASAKVTQLQKEYDAIASGKESTQTNLANAKSQELLASLGTAKQDDPGSLWALFSKDDNATTLAQPMMNQYHLQYGDTAHAMSGTYLDNIVGMTLGMKPSVDLASLSPQERERVLHEQALFGGEDMERIGKVSDKLGEASDEVGGDKGSPHVALLPVVWGSKDVGMTTTTLYRVDGAKGEKFVDDQGNIYDDWHEYRYENGLPPTDSKIVLPKDGHLKVDDSGNVITETGKASLETGWDKFKREWHMDYVVAGVTIVGGVLVDAAGILTMPIGVGVGLEVLGTSMIVAGIGYGAYEAGHDLVKLADHGQSLNPITNSQARMDMIMLGSSVLAGGAVKAGFQASMASRTALSAERAGMTDASLAARGAAQGYRSTAMKLGIPAAVAGVEPMAEQSVMAAANWDKMTDTEKSQYWQQMALGASQIFVNPALRSGMKSVAARHGWISPQAAGPGSVQVGERPAGAVPDALAEVTGKAGDLAVGAAHERGQMLDVKLPGVADPASAGPVTVPTASHPAQGAPQAGQPAAAPPGAKAGPQPGAAAPRTRAAGPADMPTVFHADPGAGDTTLVNLRLQQPGAADPASGTSTAAAAARPDAKRAGQAQDPSAVESGTTQKQARDPRRQTQERARDPRTQALGQLRDTHPRAVIGEQGRVVELRGADGRPLGGRPPAEALRYTSAKTGADSPVPQADTGGTAAPAVQTGHAAPAPVEAPATADPAAALAPTLASQPAQIVRTVEEAGAQATSTPTSAEYEGTAAARRGTDALPQRVGGKRQQVRALPQRAQAYDAIRKGEAPGSLFKPSQEQKAYLDYVTGDKAARNGDAVRFLVSDRAPHEVFVNEGGEGLPIELDTVVHGTFDDARAAAAGKNGAWVYRVSGPERLVDESLAGPRLDPKRVEGAVRVFDDGELFPAAAPNLKHEVPYTNPMLGRLDTRSIRPSAGGRYWQEKYVDAGLKFMQVKDQVLQKFGRGTGPTRAEPGERPPVSAWAREVVGQPRRENRVADVHFHRLPYDRRLALTIGSMLNTAGDTVRIAFGAIPQGCGKGYYSAKDSPELTFKNAWRLDGRFARDFMGMTPEQQARADVMITGKNPAEPGFKEYVRTLMQEHPGVFKGIGELTVHKEYVTAMLGKEQVRLDARSLKEVFEAADEFGLVLLVHNDWGHAPVGPDGLHTAGHEGYQYFDKLIDLASEHQNVRLVLAHTGIGRYFRPNAEPGTFRVNGEDRVVPEHVARLYTALERAPNTHFDISWNDVGEAYVFDPRMGDALVNFIVEHPDRVLYGSDSVKPPNQAFYEHNRTTLEPLLNRLEQRSPLAAWLLERGNYERLFGEADVDSVNRTSTLLRGKGREADALEMEQRTAAVRELQRQTREKMVRDDPRLVDQVRTMRTEDPSNPLLRMFDDLDLDTPLPGEGRTQVAGARAAGEPPHGVGAEGKEGLRSLDHLRQPPDKRAVNREYDQTLARNQREDLNVTPSSREAQRESKGAIRAVAAALGLTATGAAAAELSHMGPAAQNNADMGAFFLRSVAGLGRSLYKEWVRFATESLFEEGHISQDKIDWYINRVQKLGRSYGVDEARMKDAIDVTEQFRVDIDHIQNTPLRPGESHADRFKVVSAAAGLWAVRLDRALGNQSSSLDITNPRHKVGQFFRLVVLTTFAHNAVKNGIYFTGGEHSFLESAQHGMYLLADAALATHAAFGLASGRNGLRKTDGTWTGSNWEERVPAIRKLQAYSMPLFSAASAALTAVDLSHGRLGYAAMDAAFTVGTGWTARNEIMADQRLGQPKTAWRAAAPAVLTSLAIAARVLYGVNDVQDPQPQKAADPQSNLLPPMPTQDPVPPLSWPTGDPALPHPEAPPIRHTVAVDDGDRASGSLWGIAESHVDTLLTPAEQARAQQRGGHDAVVAQALSQLIQLNPERGFRTDLMDGVVSQAAGDPDRVVDGWNLEVKRAGA
ncbi:LWXIA domain-containing protein [Ideonella sp. BN130291]|uniref:LWXIA domain-containing protein n=1 Tax=Ideonella sp. BN130291 TaxID=3112940 RepID=UPI002E256992|nr:LWXIA domain-containing protein [Ideonella sp. BN130291]